MLEVRYNKDTKKVTAWCGDPKQFNIMGCWHYEAIVIVDISIPEKSCLAYLFDETTQTLIADSDYVEPKPIRNPLVEIDELKAKYDELKTKVETLEKK